MRKCDACGYLLFGDGDTCTHCGVTLAPVSAAAPAFSIGTAPPARLPVPPPAPRFPTTPPPPAAPQYRGAPVAPTAAAPYAGPPGVWTPDVGIAAPPVVINTAPARSTRTGRIALAVVMLLVVAGIGGAVYLRSHAVPAGTNAFVDGHGISYTSADGTYTAQLPQQPTLTQQPVTVGQYSSVMALATVQTDDYEIGTASMPMPVAVPPDRVDAALDESMREGLASISDGKTGTPRHFVRDGYPAAEVSFTAKDGYPAHALVMLGGNTVYVMFSHAKTGAGALFDALEKSFKVTGGF